MPINREVQDRRRKALVEIVSASPIRRQSEIVRALRKEGYKLTQSSG
jgi:arginine repressor